VPFKNELAVIVARNALWGAIKTYPVVEMEFHPEANQVEYVLCPARISKEVADKADASGSCAGRRCVQTRWPVGCRNVSNGSG
jgi:phosphoribosylaminoimidazole carboxylase (NCAIR synthetase)